MCPRSSAASRFQRNLAKEPLAAQCVSLSCTKCCHREKDGSSEPSDSNRYRKRPRRLLSAISRLNRLVRAK
jgi:hypothetical protein